MGDPELDYEYLETKVVSRKTIASQKFADQFDLVGDAEKPRSSAV